MFKSAYLKILLVFCSIFILASCSSAPDIYNFQRPTSVEECYEIIVDIKDNYDMHMFLLREEKLDGVNVSIIYEPAHKLLAAWDKSVELLGIYNLNDTKLNKRRLYDSINELKKANREFLTASNKILGMDIVQ